MCSLWNKGKTCGVWRLGAPNLSARSPVGLCSIGCILLPLTATCHLLSWEQGQEQRVPHSPGSSFQQALFPPLIHMSVHMYNVRVYEWNAQDFLDILYPLIHFGEFL